jgi:diamine N-acetyltransferase
MSQKLTFKTADQTDIPVIRELAGRIWSDYYPGIITRAQIEHMLEWMYSVKMIRAELERGVVWKLASLEGVAAGFLAIELEAAERKLKLHKLYLLPELHGRGLGRAMLDLVKADAIQMGADQIHLQVNKRNIRAIQAYKRAGFGISQAIVADIGGGFVMDDYVMCLKLKSSSDHSNTLRM